MSNGLRFRDTTAMPDSIRQAVERAEQKAQRLQAVPAPVEKGDKRRSKFGAVRTSVHGMSFDSKKEARRYEVLEYLRTTGQVAWFTRQVPFWLEGGVRMVVDFLVMYADERGLRLEDTKSTATMTQVYINKKKQLRARYGLEVFEV